MNNERDEIIQVLLLNSTWDLIFVSKLIHDDYSQLGTLMKTLNLASKSLKNWMAGKEVR